MIFLGRCLEGFLVTIILVTLLLKFLDDDE